MLKVRLILTCAVWLTALGSIQSYASDVVVWYDQERQAIAIDTYAGGRPYTIDFDFNDDPIWHGVIHQNGWHYLYGDKTSLGLVKVSCDNYAVASSTNYYYCLRQYGWAGFLGTLDPVYDFSAQGTTIFTGEQAPDGYYYFTPEWDVSTGKTIVYVQPIFDSQIYPVTESDLSNFSYRLYGSTIIGSNSGEWQQIPVITPTPQPDPAPQPNVEPQPDPAPQPDVEPQPDPAPQPDVEPQPYPDQEPKTEAQKEKVKVKIDVSPSVLNSKSKGNWVTVKIELPEGYLVDDLDLDSVDLSINSDIVDSDKMFERVSMSTKVATPGNKGNNLIAKFDRKTLMELLPMGEAKIYVHGKLNDGSAITGETLLELIQ